MKDFSNTVVYFQVLVFILSYYDVIDETLMCDHSDESSWSILSRGLIWSGFGPGAKKEGCFRRLGEVTAELACCPWWVGLTFFSASNRSLSSSWRWCAWTQIVSRLSAFILSITLCWSIPRFVSLNRESLRCCNSSAREECSFLQIKNIHEWRIAFQKLRVSQNFRLNLSAVSGVF